MEELVTCEGTVHSIIFQNAENGYTVLRLLTEEGEVITVVGCIPCVAPGEHLAVSGVPETHPQHGEQLKAQELERTLRQAGELALTESLNVTAKGKSDFVTSTDLAVDRCLRGALPRLAPGSRVFSEEEADGGDLSGRVFIVDPIDGTTNFTRRMNYSSISVALVHNGQTEYGVVYNPYVGELFAARRGHGATLNGAPIHVSGNDVPHAIVVCGSTIYDRTYTDRNFSILRRLYDRCLDYRRFASAALDCCQIAAGRAEIFFECRLSPWDYAAGTLIAQEAGATATRLEGGPMDPLHAGSVFITNGVCHSVLSELQQ